MAEGDLTGEYGAPVVKPKAIDRSKIAEGFWGIRYTWSTNTEASDPGTGKVKVNAAKTVLRISETDLDGNGLAAYLATWDDSTSTASRGTLIIRQVFNPKRFLVLTVTGVLTDEGTFDKFEVAKVAEGEALENNAEVTVDFYRTGDQGPSSLEESSSITWWQSKITSVREAITGRLLEKLHQLVLSAIAPNGNTAMLLIQTHDEEPSEQAILIRAIAGVEQRTVLDGAGRASYVQVPTVSKITDYGLVEALPSSPSKGDRCQFIASKTDGVIWHLVYDGEGTYPWKKIGGPPLAAFTNAQATYTSKTYVSPTGALSLNTPLAGDYDVQQDAVLFGAAALQLLCSHSVGATAASDEWSFQVYASSANPTITSGNKARHLGIAKAAAITEKVRSVTGGEGGIVTRRLWLDPVRVGK